MIKHKDIIFVCVWLAFTETQTHFRMSSIIALDTLKIDQKETISNALSFVQKKAQEQFMQYQAPSKPVKFYKVTQDEEQASVQLPFKFAKCICGSYLNDSIQFETKDYRFISSLRENQIVPSAKCIEILRASRSVTLCLPPGYGKTIIGAYVASNLGLKTAVIVPRTTLCSQWKKTFMLHTNMRVAVVGDHDTEITTEDDVIICLDIRWSKIDESVRASCGFLIIDEAHMMCSESKVACFFAWKPRYIMAETATPYREDGMYSMITAIVGKETVYPEVSESPGAQVGTMVQKKPPFKAYVKKVDILIEEHQGAQGGVDYMKICSDLSTNDQYNLSIVDIIASNTGRKFIVLTRLVEHCSTLQRMLSERGISSDTLMGMKKEYKDTNVLIGTMSKIGVGFDEENQSMGFSGVKSDTLILAHTIKQKSHLVQYVGRVMRSNDPMMIMMTTRNKVLLRHVYQIRKELSQEGVSMGEYV